MKSLPLSLVTLGLASAVAAQAPTLAVSIGVRETGAAGAIFTNIGDNGTAAGGIEWVNKDGQQLTLDGTWQQFTFDFATDPIAAFAGTTANGVIDGTFGTLEHIRLLNSGGFTGVVTVWLDDVADTIDPGTGPQTTTFGTFAGYADGTEVMFQEPSFSGSTSGNINPGSTAGIDNYVASRTASYKFQFQFIDGQPTRWVRLTSFNTVNQGNPFVRFDQASTVSFWMRGGVEQANLGSQGPGTAIAEMVGDGMMTGQQSTYYNAGAMANAPGALFVSFPNQPDVPFLGGNLVSFLGNITNVPLTADNNGRIALTLSGTPSAFDLVFQAAYIDPSLPQFVAYTNANLVKFGQ